MINATLGITYEMGHCICQDKDECRERRPLFQQGERRAEVSLAADQCLTVISRNQHERLFP